MLGKLRDFLTTRLIVFSGAPTLTREGQFTVKSNGKAYVYYSGAEQELGGGGGGGAPTTAQYLTLALDGTLSAERRFVPTLPLSASDGGANGDYTLSLSGWSGTTNGDMLYRNGTAVGTKTAAQARTWLDLATYYQPLDADLTAYAALSTTGLVVRTGAGTVAARTLTGPAAGITVSNGDGVSGNPTLALADDLAAVEGLSGTGIAVRTATSTWATRTLTAGSGVTITNGDGVSGNPTISSSGGTNTDLDPTTGYAVSVQPAGATVASPDASLTVRSASAANNTSTLRRTRFTGSAIAMDWYFAPNVRLDMSFSFKARLFTGASIAATCRYKIGFGVGGFTTTDTETATSYILIRASTVLGDTTWKVVTYNGTTATTTDTTVAFAAATEYLFTITTSPSSITVTINGVDTVITATLPAASTDLTACQCGLLGSTSAREWFFVGARLLVTYP